MVTEPPDGSFLPTTASVRALLDAVLVSDADLDAFCLDYFPDIKRRFSDGMERTRKLTILLEHQGSCEILARLREWEPEAVAAMEHLLSRPRGAAVSSQGPAGSPPRPPGEAYDPGWYIHRDRAERNALSCLDTPGKPTILWGPERFGKTWLLEYLLGQMQERCRLIRVSLDRFDEASRNSYDLFLTELSTEIAEGIGRGREWLAPIWETRGRGPNRRLTALLKEVLRESEGPLVLAMDRADAILECDFRDDFFGLLRSFAEEAAREPWHRLRLLLAVSTMPTRLTKSIYNSPFTGLSEPVEIESLELPQLQRLGALYGPPWTGAVQISQLMEQVGGHPYLVRLAMHAAVLHGVRPEQVLSSAGGLRIFEQHLRHCREALEKHPPLLQALREVGRAGTSHVDVHAYEHLHRMGLVIRDAAGTYRLRCRLYEGLVG